MKLKIRHLCLFGATQLVLFFGASQAAEDSQESVRAKAKLAELRGRITALTSQLAAELQQRDGLTAHLRDADLEITAKRLRFDTLRNDELAAERRRAELRADDTRVQHELELERAALAAQVRAAYMIGPQERIKLLLNQSDPASAGRTAVYYGYFARERALKIGEIDAQVTKLAELGAQLGQVTANLQSLQEEAAHDLAGLQSARAERAVALAAVSRQVASGGQELSELTRQEQAEEALVADLAQMLQDLPVDTQQNFDTLRGKLAWPVQGRLTARYQEAGGNAGAGLRRNGVLIEAARGAKVRAPYYGRVIYADWLPGLGLLLIIGHTGNYMTLYGHAEVLYKSVGDWVAPGDVIAGLSDASGVAPHLYFEIRAGRTPKDPGLWLKAGP